MKRGTKSQSGCLGTLCIAVRGDGWQKALKSGGVFVRVPFLADNSIVTNVSCVKLTISKWWALKVASISWKSFARSVHSRLEGQKRGKEKEGRASQNLYAPVYSAKNLIRFSAVCVVSWNLRSFFSFLLLALSDDMAAGKMENATSGLKTSLALNLWRDGFATSVQLLDNQQ